MTMKASRRGFLIGSAASALGAGTARAASAVKGNYAFEQVCIAPPRI
jgi:hypothetical protein